MTQLADRLFTMAKARNASGLLLMMRSMSNSAFRACSRELGERVLPELPDSQTYWALFVAMVPTQPRAYLGTFLKAAAKRYTKGTLDLLRNATQVEEFAASASAIDKRKTIDVLLPIVKDTEEIKMLLRLFAPQESTSRIDLLLVQPDRPAICYVLFGELRQHDADQALLRRTALRLMQKTSPNAFKMARIVQAYFGLGELPGTLSLRLEPYEFSSLEQGEEAFYRMLRK